MFKHRIFKFTFAAILFYTVFLQTLSSQYLYEGKIKISEIRTDKISDKFVVSFVIDFQNISLKDNEYLLISPSLKIPGYQKGLKPITINGKSQHKYYERVRALTKAKPDSINDSYVLRFENSKRFKNKLLYVSELPYTNGIEDFDLSVKTEECACNGKTARTFEDDMNLRKTVSANIVNTKPSVSSEKEINDTETNRDLLIPELVRADYTIWYAPGKSSGNIRGIDADSELFKNTMKLASELGLKNEKELVDLLLMLKKNKVDSLRFSNSIKVKPTVPSNISDNCVPVESVKSVEPVEPLKSVETEKSDETQKTVKKDDLILKHGNISIYKSDTDSGSKFFVQVGAFRKKSNAERVYSKMIEIFPETSIKVEDNYHKVRIGYYDSADEAFESIKSVRWNDIYINNTK